MHLVQEGAAGREKLGDVGKSTDFLAALRSLRNRSPWVRHTNGGGRNGGDFYRIPCGTLT